MIFSKECLKNIFKSFHVWRFNSIILFLVALLFKISFFLLIYNVYSDNYPHLFNNPVGDDKVYIEFSENLYLYGEYFVNSGIYKDYTFRMPAIDFIYYPLRCMFSKEVTLDLIICLQVILSAIASVYLAKLAELFFNKKIIFYLVFLFSIIGVQISFPNNLLMRESFAYSSLILSLYFFVKGFKKDNRILFFTSGALFSWLIFLRPFTIILFLVLNFHLIIKFLRNKKVLINIIFFNFLIVILLSFWTYRNYKLTDKFIPLESSINWANSQPLKLKLKFIKSFGFRWEPWMLNSQSGWINNSNSSIDFNQINKLFPKRTFNGDLNQDSLINLKYHYNSFEKTSDIKMKLFHEKESVRLFKKFIENLKNERPLDYYILNKLRSLKSFLNENTCYLLKNYEYPINVIGIFSETYFNILIKTLGFIGFFILFVNLRSSIYKISILFFPLFLILYFPIFSGIDESRFFYLAIPSFLIFSSYTIYELLKSKNIYKISLFLLIIILPIYPSLLKLYELVKF